MHLQILYESVTYVCIWLKNYVFLFTISRLLFYFVQYSSVFNENGLLVNSLFSEFSTR